METHFDAWAATYDADVRADPEAFPFAGYDAVLAAMTEVVRALGARRVLELGIGTGNLAARVAAAVPGVELWGVDFSAGMLARAGEKLPGARLVRAEIDGDPSGWDLPAFGAVVSSSAPHEIPDDRKVGLVERLFRERLTPGGVVTIGDIAFADETRRDAVRGTPGVRLDGSEHSVVADRFLAELGPRGNVGAFRPVSFCAGVFVLRTSGDGGFQQTTTTA